MKPSFFSTDKAAERKHAETLTDAFLAKRLPAWLQKLPTDRVKPLHDAMLAHDKSLRPLTLATRPLLSPQQFAALQLQPLIDLLLDEPRKLDELECLERWYVATVTKQMVPTVEERSQRSPALLRLMHNFSSGKPLFENAGLVAIGEDQILLREVDITLLCRELDVGQEYQQMLDEVFVESTQGLLAEHKRTAFALACELAICKGHLTLDQYVALSQLGKGEPATADQKLTATPGELSVLGCSLSNGMLLQLQGSAEEDEHVIVYQPDDPDQVFRSFPSLAALSAFFVEALRKDDVLRAVYGQVRTRERADFALTLSKRLTDDVPDLELQSVTSDSDVFSILAKRQVERLKDDGRLLLVPTDDADDAAARARLEVWKGIGFEALGLAGLFVPVIGVALFGYMVADTLHEAYEGVVDWSEGHQHEALEHLFKVVATVAVVAATGVTAVAAAGALRRSVFVDGLEPVNTSAGPRLWNDDLQSYAVTPDNPSLRDDGLYEGGGQRYLRIDEHYYPLHQDAPGQAWRLRHPQRADAYAPPVVFNGERCWRLRSERVLEWDDSTQMLNRLWPMDPPLSAEKADQILRVADVDKEELRGMLAQSRPLPVSLRDTLRRYQAAVRLERLFGALETSADVIGDAQVLAWCNGHSDLQGIAEEDMGAVLLERRGDLWSALLKHLAEELPHATDGAQTEQAALLGYLKRDLPGLPPAYALQVVRDVDPITGNLASFDSRVPMQVMTHARAALSMARLTRALEGLLLGTDYHDGTGEPGAGFLGEAAQLAPVSESGLRQFSPFGRRIALQDPSGAREALTTLVWRAGRFYLYDSDGLALDIEVEEPAGLFQAIVALLDEPQRKALGIAGNDSPANLRKAIIKGLPGDRKGLLERVGWTTSAPTFTSVQRLPDSRVGYPLGNFLAREMGYHHYISSLRRRVRVLYPTLTVAEGQSLIEEWVERGRDPFDELLSQEMNYASLDDALSRWERAADEMTALRARRRQFADRLRGAWRYEGRVVTDNDGHVLGRELDLSGWQVENLPNLPSTVDLDHIVSLNMSGMDLLQMPRSFLSCFENLQTLTLNNNLLTTVPSEIGRLTDLRVLHIRHNLIQMDAAGAALLSRLSELRMLVMDHNPLRTLNLDFAQLRELRVLRAANCALRTVPRNLELSTQLTVADLPFNQISSLPQGLLDMPRVFRRGVNLTFNPLTMADFAALAVDDEVSPIVVPRPDSEASLRQWLEAVDTARQPARRALWGRVAAFADSDALIDLLGELTHSQDYRQNVDHSRAYVTDQVWQLLEQVDDDEALRADLFAHAGVQLTCHDSVAERFSRLWLRALVHAAENRAQADRGGEQLLELGRALFRMERLDAFARQEVNWRQARGEVVDELEVVLGFRVNLAARLGLVGQPRSMLFGSLANITPELADRAYDAVMLDEASGALAESLGNQEFWSTYLEQRYRQLFSDHRDEFAARGTALEEREEAGELQGEAYRLAYEQLADEREAIRLRIVITLTQEALAQAAAGIPLDAPEADEAAEAVTGESDQPG